MEKAVQVLKQGGILIFPTDTAFGIGCRMDDEKAIRKLFNLRKRPGDQPASILVESVEMAEKYWKDIPVKAHNLMTEYWPGALTVICKAGEKVSPLLLNERNGLGIRYPDNRQLLEVIRGVGVPILGPSANFHGQKTPFLYEELDNKLIMSVDFVLPGYTKIKQVSTVVDFTKIPYEIVRQGGVKI
ncbi:MAG: SUA5/yciO/yrdC family protein [Candidatus Gottesmanbacteria bacterium GW2011_GWC2_39_8]|nr:MAG: SUA5/yciO/yrdC family protein [Candidatus Gottesmanbacteria bacterium GW2011_GWC2_39_8]